MEMCPKDVVDIHIPRRDDDNRLMGPPIIKLIETTTQNSAFTRKRRKDH